MKYTTYLFALAAISFTFIFGCKPAADRTTDSATETTRQQMTRTEADVRDATRDMKAYSYEQKAQFIASMETELAAINRSIDELADRIDRSGAEAKANATPRLNELRHQAGLLEAQIDEVKDATASNWDKVKATTRETYGTLKNNFDDARQWMSDKIEP